MTEFHWRWPQEKRLLMHTLDPVHIGIGGGFGAVDLQVLRETNTNLPIVPGSSLNGVIRAYAAQRLNGGQCSGQRDHCGNCIICYAFGYANGVSASSRGTVRVQDAEILLFPVASGAGPIWITTKARLARFGFMLKAPNSHSGLDDHRTVYLTLPRTAWNHNAIPIGWLLLQSDSGWKITPPDNATIPKVDEPIITQRTAIVPERLFSHLVNINLERRTSVSIDPETGAAQDGALFTYEAMPRSTWLVGGVTADDFRGTFDKADRKAAPQADVDTLAQLGRVTTPMDVAQVGWELLRVLGVGGMGTRGFGRTAVVSEWSVSWPNPTSRSQPNPTSPSQR